MNTVHTNGAVNSPEGVAHVTPKADTPLPQPAEWHGVARRTGDYIRRAFGPRNTAVYLSRALGRKSSLRGARAILEGTRTLTLPDFVRLYHTPGFGMPFAREVLGLPEDADLTRLIGEVERLKAIIEGF